MDIGARISFFRTQKNYTVNKLANMEILSFVCDALDISLSDFFDDDTAKRITSDPLLNTIYRLNSEQREALNLFLNTLLK